MALLRWRKINAGELVRATPTATRQWSATAAALLRRRREEQENGMRARQWSATATRGDDVLKWSATVAADTVRSVKQLTGMIVSFRRSITAKP